MSKTKPPKLADRFFTWYCNDHLMETIQGDLHERFYDDLNRYSSTRAKWGYWLNVLRFINRHTLQREASQDAKINNIMMFKNYFLITSRHLLRNKSYSLLNLTGLIVGFTSALLMTFYALDELSYDKHFPNAERVYRVGQNMQMPDDEITAVVTSHLLGKTLMDEVSGIEAHATLWKHKQFSMKVGEETITESQTFSTSKDFIKVFGISLLEGDPVSALDKRFSILISEKIANAHFRGLDAVGQTLETNSFGPMTISGVMKDFPDNTHFHPEIIVSHTFDPVVWANFSAYTYLLLEKDISQAAIESSLPAFVEKYLSQPVMESHKGKLKLFLQRLTDIHLRSNHLREIEANGNYSFVLMVITLAIVIALIAAVNYMNLSTAKATKRVKEVGIRKVLGSNQTMIRFQFLTESLMFCISAGLGALVLTAILIPFYNYFADKSASFSDIINLPFLSGYVGFIFLIGLISGSYPAFFVSRFSPAKILKKEISLDGSHLPLSKFLNTLQFSTSLVMIIVAWMVYRQLDHLRNQDLGFNKEQIVKVDMSEHLNIERMLLLKNELLTIPAVELVSSSMQSPGDDVNMDALSFETKNGFEIHKMQFTTVDKDFQQLMGLEIIAGETFKRNDMGSEVIINEKLAKNIGYKPIEAIAKRVKLPLGPEHYGHIVGVIKDFHIKSPRYPIEPLALINVIPLNPLVYVKINEASNYEILQKIERTATDFLGHDIALSFLDADFDRQYQADQKRGELLVICAGLASLMAFIGFVGLINYSLELKEKEMTIRKILGAVFYDIFYLSARNFGFMCLLSVVIATPLAYYLVQRWLENFASAIKLPFDVFIWSTIAMIMAAGLIVYLQSAKNHLRNSWEVLRKE